MSGGHATGPTIRLEPDQLRELASLIAAELRTGHTDHDQPLVDAATVAKALGLSRAAVYARANELGAVRVGDGSRARLRFDLERAREALRSAPAPPSSSPPRPRKQRAQQRERVLQARPRKVRP